MWKKYGKTEYEVNLSGKVRHHGKILKTVINNAGYALVHLTICGKSMMVAVHKLVAECHVPNPNGYSEIDHLDRNKLNNRAKNLHWVTRKQNMSNMSSRGKRKRVECYDSNGKYIRSYRTVSEAQRAVGITSQGIKACCKGYQKSCAGYQWQYEKEYEQLYLF